MVKISWSPHLEKVEEPVIFLEKKENRVRNLEKMECPDLKKVKDPNLRKMDNLFKPKHLKEFPLKNHLKRFLKKLKDPSKIKKSSNVVRYISLK